MFLMTELNCTDCGFVCVVGTTTYLDKAEAQDRNAVIQAEVELINNRWLRRAFRETVLPLLRSGTPETALPRLLRGSVHLDFRRDIDFPARLFDMVLRIHRIPFYEPMARQYRAAFMGGRDP